MNDVLRFMIALFLTHRIYWGMEFQLQALIIGATVASLGAMTEGLGAPILVIVIITLTSWNVGILLF